MNKVFVIAEAGVNHNGSVEMALELVEAAYAAGADAVKFQTFLAQDVVTPNAATADYQLTNTGETNQFEMIRKLELDEQAHRRIARHAKEVGIEFFSTPFSEDAVDMLVRLGVRRIKIPSGEITNVRLLHRAAATGLPLLVSTGMSTMEEVERAVAWIRQVRPGKTGDLVLLHCTSAYPPPPESLNLRAMPALAARTGLPVGYSDHSLGAEAALAAVALGAEVIEKHITLDKSLPGPDHVASADPEDFARMVQGIRVVEAMLGDGVKRPQAVEANTIEVARRSVVAMADLPRGHILRQEDLGLRRPGNGIAPEHLSALVSMRTAVEIKAHTTLQWAMIDRKE